MQLILTLLEVVSLLVFFMGLLLVFSATLGKKKNHEAI